MQPTVLAATLRSLVRQRSYDDEVMVTAIAAAYGLDHWKSAQYHTCPLTTSFVVGRPSRSCLGPVVPTWRPTPTESRASGRSPSGGRTEPRRGQTGDGAILQSLHESCSPRRSTTVRSTGNRSHRDSSGCRRLRPINGPLGSGGDVAIAIGGRVGDAVRDTVSPAVLGCHPHSEPNRTARPQLPQADRRSNDRVA